MLGVDRFFVLIFRFVLQFFCDFQRIFFITFFLLFFETVASVVIHFNVLWGFLLDFFVRFHYPLFLAFFLLFQFLFSKKIICFIFIFRGDHLSNGFAQKAPARVFLQKLQRRHGITESNRHIFSIFLAFYIFIIYVGCIFTIL